MFGIQSLHSIFTVFTQVSLCRRHSTSNASTARRAPPLAPALVPAITSICSVSHTKQGDGNTGTRVKSLLPEGNRKAGKRDPANPTLLQLVRGISNREKPRGSFRQHLSFKALVGLVLTEQTRGGGMIKDSNKRRTGRDTGRVTPWHIWGSISCQELIPLSPDHYTSCWSPVKPSSAAHQLFNLLSTQQQSDPS